MADHDQRFKELLREFFPEFIALFFPDWAERFDFAACEWVDKEVFADPPQGERRYLDLAARVPVRQALATGDQPEVWVALLHVEIESAEAVTGLRPRMCEYYQLLRQRYRLPVLPVGLLLRVGLDGLGWDVYEEQFWERTILRFEYAYVGLPALDADHYLTGANWLGVALAALMRVPEERKAWLKAEALRRLVGSGQNDWRRFLLCETVQAYLTLQEPQLKEFEDLLVTEPYKEVLPMTQTWFEQGVEKGIEKERKRWLGVVRAQLANRFGSLSELARQRLENLDAEQLEDLAVALVKAASLQELGLED
jgi:hypothetical protein